ncbi:MAG: hypothetical protein AMJ43_06485 [Coxiella sp. DG_40]|nr:MAG: hypothetical protein AMJ43_06485 [Coxiella sp. DG_40]
MEIKELSKNIVLAVLSGDGQVENELEEARQFIDGNGSCHLVLDFTSVEMIDSSIITELLSVRELLNKRQRRLVISGLSFLNRSVFVAAGLLNVFKLVNDKKSALIALENTC